MKKTAVEKEPPPPRPPCGCGAPATHMIRLSVTELELDREAGVKSTAYWISSYRRAHTSVETHVCAACLPVKVRVAVAVDVSLENAKPSNAR